MRITDNILFNNFLFNINKVNEKMYITNSEMASGKRLLDLSSDPIALSKVLSLKDINMRFDQYVTNIDSATSVLNAEDTALSNADDLIHKAGELLVQGANSTNNDEASRTAIANQLDAITDELRNSANTIFQGKYLFSGYKTDTQPIQDEQQEVAVTSNSDAEVETSRVFKDINQLQSGNYRIVISSGRLSLVNAAGEVVPIDADLKDESDVGGNQLSDSVDISGYSGKWIDLGRGIKIKVDDVNKDQVIDISYKAGGKDLYMGDDGERDVEYSDGLTSPITITAKQIYKPTNQTLENNNFMLDKTTSNPVTKQTKLTDISLTEALSNVALQTGYEIQINGTDHNGNLVKGVFSITSSNLTIQDLINKVESLDSTEVLENNKALIRSDNTLAVASTTLGSLGFVTTTSTLVFSGTTHDGVTVNVSMAVSAGTTLASIASYISANFDASASVEHGRIVIEDNQAGESALSVRVQTKTAQNPIFGYFYEKSAGGSGGFKDTVDGYVKNGHLYFVDKRPSDSKFNISFSIKDTSVSPPVDKPNIFGVFNVKTIGRGIDVFREMRDASYALKHPDAGNQIGIPSQWMDGSTLSPKVSGTYLGGINDQWTVKVTKGSDDLSQNGAEADLLVTNSKNDTVATIHIANDNGKYDIQVKNSQGIIIYNVKDAPDLSNIVIETRDASNSFTDQQIGTNGLPGVTLSLNQTGLKPVLKTGDNFTFKLTNAIENALGKSQDALNQILTARSIVGARTNRMSLAKDRISFIRISNNKTISHLEDANMAKVFSDYKRNLIVMQALLNVGAHLTSYNLFDYLK